MKKLACLVIVMQSTVSLGVTATYLSKFMYTEIYFSYGNLSVMEKSESESIHNSFLSDKSCMLQGREQSSSLRIKKNLPSELFFTISYCGISYSSGIGHIQNIQDGRCSDLM